MLPKNVLRLVVALTLLSLAFSSLLPSNELGDSKLPQRKLKEGKGYWSTKGNRIVDEDGDLVFFSGINWNGFESANCIVDGLWVRSYSSYLDQMKVLGFNLIRLPFAGSCVQEGVVPIKTAIDLEKNPDLLAKTSIEAMQSVVQAAGDKGMRVILDYHRRDVTDKTGKPEDGLWYNETYPTSYWLDTWKSVATALKDYDAVVGVDLFNEPHFGGAVAPVWDMSTNDNNWRYAALTAAEAILEINPAWLICVEGMYYDANWGGNLIPLLQYPLNLTERREGRMEAAMAASQEGTAAAQAAALTWHQSEEEKRAPLTWSRELTFSLIECWSERFNMLGGGNLTRSHWEKIAKTLIENHPGLDISWKQCQDKLQNLRKAFKAHVSKEEYKGGIGKSAMEWPYFEAMALALGKKGKAVSSTPNFGSGGMGFSQHRGASVGLANELGGERNGGEFSNPEHEHRKAMSSGNNGGEEDGLKVMTKKKKRKVLSDDASASLMERILEAQTRAEERQMQADERDKQWKKDMMEMALAFQLRIAQTLAQALAQPPPEKPRDR